MKLVSEISKRFNNYSFNSNSQGIVLTKDKKTDKSKPWSLLKIPKIIDLSADFRFEDINTFEKNY